MKGSNSRVKQLFLFNTGDIKVGNDGAEVGRVTTQDRDDCRSEVPERGQGSAPVRAGRVGEGRKRQAFTCCILFLCQVPLGSHL